jgi:hypothetical protein
MASTIDREVAVRFQTHEAVSIQDPEIVLRALETCLRGVSKEVVRYGDKITLHGLGPSPRSMNYQDTTVLSVSAEDDKTIINADVSFQASAILGDVPQDAVVRSKLDQVFEQMRTQIELESRGIVASLVAAYPMRTASSSSLPDGWGPENHSFGAPADAISSTPAAALETAEESTEEPTEEAEVPVPLPIPHEEAEDHGEEDSSAGLVAMLRRQAQTDDSESGGSRRWIWAVSVIAVLFLLVGGIYLAKFRHRAVVSPAAATAAPAATPVTDQPVAATTAAASPAAAPAGERTVTKVDAATIGPPTPPDSTEASAAKGPIADPATWVDGWAAAMRSRDPVAQASFYANPVNQYIDRRNVSHAALVQAKTADIGRRHGEWTFGANNVVVESRTPSQATVQLVKHYMVRTGPSQVSEIFVKTRLQLKAVDGQWKIASEEELRSPAVASINPITQ